MPMYGLPTIDEVGGDLKPDDQSAAARYLRGELSPMQYRAAFRQERTDAIALANARAAGGSDCLGCGKPAKRSALGQFCSPACANEVWTREAIEQRESLGRALDAYDQKAASK